MFLPSDLSQIALADPRAVYALLFGRSAQKQPQVYTMDATFVSGAVNEHIEAKIDPQFCNDFLIVEARYQVRVNPGRFTNPNLVADPPTATSGPGSLVNVQAAQSALDVAKNPFVDVLFTSQGGFSCPKYFFSTKPVAIETICKHADTVTSSWGNFPFGFVAGATSTIKADLYLRRNLVNIVTPVAPNYNPNGNEVPYQVIISFIGMDLGCNRLEIPLQVAVDGLKAAKILPSEFVFAAETK